MCLFCSATRALASGKTLANRRRRLLINNSAFCAAKLLQTNATNSLPTVEGAGSLGRVYAAAPEISGLAIHCCDIVQRSQTQPYAIAATK